MKLTIFDKGDSSVGIPEQQFTVDCPFEKDDFPEEDMEFFRQKQIEAFADFCDSDIYALFDFEIEAEEIFDTENGNYLSTNF